MKTSSLVLNFAAATAIALISLYLVKALDISYPLTVTTTSKSTELAVVGEGKVSVIPDTAYVDAGITVNNVSTAAEARKQMDTINNAIIEAVKKMGIKKEDIRTTNYSIYPDYRYEGSRNYISGYNGNATVEIKIKSTDTASQVMETVTQAGANQINGTRFVVEDPQKYRSEAREKAIENARAEAEKLTKSLGIKLGKVINIVEASPDNGAIPLMDRAYSAKSMGGGGGPSLEAGSQTITSVVTLYFEKK